MVKIQFISVSALKEKSVIQTNVDEKLLNIAIKEFQEIELKKILGRAEYLRIEGEALKLQNGDIEAFTEADAALWEHITPVMIYGALMYSIPAIHTKFTNKGLQEDNDQYATRASKAEARGDYSFKLDGYKRDLLDFISEQPEVVATCESSQDTTFNFTGVSLPDNQTDYEASYKAAYFKTGRR